MLSRLRLPSSSISKINKNIISSGSIIRNNCSSSIIYNNYYSNGISLRAPIDISKGFITSSNSSNIYTTMNNILYNIKNTLLPLSISYNTNTNDDVFDGIMMSSVVKKRRMKMNKHKLKKRRKLMRMNTKQSRG